MFARVVAVASVFFSGLAAAAGGPPAECDFKSFPQFWGDARDRVKVLSGMLAQQESNTPWAQHSAPAFHESLAVCDDKWQAEYGGAGTGGSNTLGIYRCQAFLICGRLAVLTNR